MMSTKNMKTMLLLAACSLSCSKSSNSRGQVEKVLPSGTDEAVDADGIDTTGGDPVPDATAPVTPNEMCTMSSSPEMFSNPGTPREIPVPFTFQFMEGPVWLENSQALLVSAWNFSDPTYGKGPPTTILKFENNAWSIWSDKGIFGSNGLAVDRDNKVIAALHDRQELAQISADGTRASLGGSYLGENFNSPNDLTVRSDGTIYFTDPNYQRDGRPGRGSVTGVYALTPERVVVPVDLNLKQPNGIALSPDETVLYAGGGDGKIFRYLIETDGNTKPDGILATPGFNVDGMAVDCAGNVYAAIPREQAVYVYAPTGVLLSKITGFGYNTTNVALGGRDKNIMFVTTAGHVFEMQLGTPISPTGSR
ncbi:MAG TPA: SMP-30/gluconolactonase/LRE family protein [Oligoflexus sp.]|uniref:SMP-30/gluconolactonase/LRE family protein n=1 Tax=Oligoflexus sp. TaxID=1971216 RepID=UPI002D3F196D|nr:SMP-30/gluconolactonase/LRE family protein [Oligoflexus sp.]HYX32821.1 SMP-30/gluconolactonase/LRE family protein [Oligoflexus sp.]